MVVSFQGVMQKCRLLGQLGWWHRHLGRNPCLGISVFFFLDLPQNNSVCALYSCAILASLSCPILFFSFPNPHLSFLLYNPRIVRDQDIKLHCYLVKYQVVFLALKLSFIPTAKSNTVMWSIFLRDQYFLKTASKKITSLSLLGPLKNFYSSFPPHLVS